MLRSNPEAFLVLEARADGGEPRWKYALARMTIYPLRAKLDGQEVWKVGHLSSNGARNEVDTFHVRRFDPEE